MKRLLASTCLLALVAATALGLRARAEGDNSLKSRLIGTWKMVSAKFDGQESELPKSTITLKHVTPTGFMWASYDPKTNEVSRTAGGSYTLVNGTYTELPEYGLGEDFKAIKGSQHAFKCRVEGDRWFHTGSLSNGLKIEEEWERVKQK